MNLKNLDYLMIEKKSYFLALHSLQNYCCNKNSSKRLNRLIVQPSCDINRELIYIPFPLANNGIVDTMFEILVEFWNLDYPKGKLIVKDILSEGFATSTSIVYSSKHKNQYKIVPISKRLLTLKTDRDVNTFSSFTNYEDITDCCIVKKGTEVYNKCLSFDEYINHPGWRTLMPDIRIAKEFGKIMTELNHFMTFYCHNENLKKDCELSLEFSSHGFVSGVEPFFSCSRFLYFYPSDNFVIK